MTDRLTWLRWRVAELRKDQDDAMALSELVPLLDELRKAEAERVLRDPDKSAGRKR